MIISTVGTGFLRLLLAFKSDVYVSFRNDRRYRMLVNKLLVYVFYQNDKIVKPFDKALQAHSICQKDYHRYFVFPELVKIIVLKTLALANRHRNPLFLSVDTDRVIFAFTINDFC